MIRHLRWQIALALAGALVIAILLFFVSGQALRHEPARGGQFVEALVGRPGTFNPLFAQSDAEVDLARLLFSGLTRPGPDGQPLPDLASDWSISADGQTYTFTLRAGALWHDLSPVTADDVVFTARLARDSAIPEQQKSRLAQVWQRVEVKKLGEHRVQMHLEEPYAPFLGALRLGILPVHLLADVPAAEIATHPFSVREPVGTGPYSLAQPDGIETGDEGSSAITTIRLVRFDAHWGNDGQRPYLDQLIFRFYPTLDKAVEALGQQAAQGLGRVPPEALNRLGADVQAYAAMQAGYTLVYLNRSEAIFDNKTVRQALSLALDRQGIIDDPDLLNGLGVVAVSPIAPGSWAYDASLPAPRYDPDEARRVLDQAGWIDSDEDGVRDHDGQPLRFTLGTRSDQPLWAAVAERIAGDWSAIGVGVEVSPLDYPDLVEAVRNRTFQTLLYSWAVPDYDPDPYALWHSSQVDFPGQNYAGFRHSEADRQLVEARQAHPKVNFAQRLELYHAFQRTFVEEQPALLLCHPVYQYVVTDPNVGGVQLPRLIVEPSDRFLTLPDWYVQTHQVLGEARRAALWR